MRQTSSKISAMAILAEWHPAISHATICVVAGVLTFYSLHLLLVILGQPPYVFGDVVGLAVMVGILMIVNLAALLVRNVWIPAAALFVIGIVAYWPFLVRGPAGEYVMPWVRQLIGYTLLPVFNALYFSWLLRLLRSHRRQL
jgi:hypothetical protein